MPLIILKICPCRCSYFSAGTISICKNILFENFCLQTPFEKKKKNCFKIKPSFSWYYGRITRADAEKLLANKPEGGFLIRISESSPGDFSLSVK